ncbi:unnamed protein product [Brassica oleracea]
MHVDQIFLDLRVRPSQVILSVGITILVSKGVIWQISSVRT